MRQLTQRGRKIKKGKNHGEKEGCVGGLKKGKARRRGDSELGAFQAASPDIEEKKGKPVSMGDKPKVGASEAIIMGHIPMAISVNFDSDGVCNRQKRVAR